MKILVVDNYDSFTYNLLESFKLEGCELDVVYNSVDPKSIDITAYDLLMLSPGPSTPKKSGYLMEYIDLFKFHIPIFGVCLGFQALVESFGGELGYLGIPVHGKVSEIIPQKGYLYSEGKPVKIGRYHSIFAKHVPEEFLVTSETKEGIPMSIEHKTLPLFGVQYHPESILSMAENVGQNLIKNVLKSVRKHDVQAIAQ